MTPLLDLPKSRAEIERLQSERKKHALAQARRVPFYKGKLDHVNAGRLDDPAEWLKIPLLDKDTLRKLDDRKFYEDFCLPSGDGIAEYWRSGGATGTPLFYPRSYHDIEAAMIGFARIYDCSIAGAAEARMCRFRSAFTRSARCWRARPARAALPSIGRAPAPRRRRPCSSN
jgi:phenylacetate-CoA ligase